MSGKIPIVDDEASVETAGDSRRETALGDANP